jgi:hypothetical protein
MMKVVFQAIFWIGTGSMSIGFLSFAVVQFRRYHKIGYLKSLTEALSPQDKKIIKFGGAFLIGGFCSLIAAFIYHMQYGLT